MTNLRKPIDAQDAEANSLGTVVPFRDKDYTVPAALDLPVELLEAEGELETMRVILGDDQYKDFRATKPTLRDLKEFSELVSKAAGFDSLGE